MTVEEKAMDYVENLMDKSRNFSGFYIAEEMSEFGIQCYETGYNEALRWRDPVNDPPKCNDLMQIKYGDIFSNIINYGHDRYLEDMGMWDIEQLASIKVLAWRPIK